MEKLYLYSTPSGLDHNTGEQHPENGRRLLALRSLFTHDYPDIPHIDHIKPIDIEWLKTIHTPEMVDYLRQTKNAQIDGDTILSPGSWQAALDSVSLACRAVDDVLNEKTLSAFCALRPPGHHAEYGRSMGFCLLNNAYCAAAHALKHDHCNRIAIVDWDVHHGNGTEHLVRTHKRNDIDYLSTHEWPLFPGTGGPDTPDHPNITNRALPSGSGSGPFRAAFSQEIIPVLNRIQPDLLIISAGFDAHADDPLASLMLSEDDFAWTTKQLQAIQPRMVMVLEGGYHVEALENCVDSVIEALIA